MLYKSLNIFINQIKTDLLCISNRYKYTDHRMVRDVKRRKISALYFNERMRLNAIRKNNILPESLQDIAHKQIIDLPRDSNYIRIRSRCVMTSRSRGLYNRFKLSRFCFRHLADHNYVSGITRATW